MNSTQTTNDDKWVVDVKDFQSIKKAHIEIEDGLNVIVGKTNEGKSAILRAINSCIFNVGTDDLVRAGHDTAGVSISNGRHSMIYCRSSKGKNEKTAYQFDNGNVQKKVGRTQLQEVVDLFGIKDVKMNNGVKVKLNFWYQNDKPFLMDKTSGQLYEFLSLSSADKYFTILKNIKADIKVQEAEINNANISIDTLKSINNKKQDFIDKNSGFDEVYSRVIKFDKEVSDLNRLFEIIEKVSSLSENIKDISSKLEEINKVYDEQLFSSISEKYESYLSGVDIFKSIYEKALSTIQTRKTIRENNEKIQSLGGTIDSIDTSSLEDRLSALYSSISDIESKIQCVEDCEKIVSKISGVEESIKSLSFIDNFSNLDDKLMSMNTLENICKKNEDSVSNISKIKEDIDILSNKIKSTEVDLQASEKVFEDYKLDLGVCPFCGSVLNEQHMMEGEICQ